MKDSPSSKQNLTFTNKPLGETLMEAGLISASQIEMALREQKIHNIKIGEIFALHNWIKQETADFFVEKMPYIVAKQKKKPLAYYFKEAGLLTDEQVNSIIKLQKRKEKKIRFHRLAVEQGYIKQLTVDFFLSNLFNIYNPSHCSFGDIYQILKSYNEGKTNFQKVELKNAPLMGISLKGVKLDGSNLREANMKGSNLTNSSLIQVNLALATMIKAVLTNVNLERACLTKANLQEAYLDKANFTSANLQGANLQESYLFQAYFGGADLRGAQLPSEYTYDVYYDSQTRFDGNFDPKKAGWQIKS
ncbi:conserved hypothetical protein [Hyella patelloides LEGE 07179]|uniref:Low-complexity protein n=1 Tax=Hyella patelloides LEGE 07179 TaxID=945734 RepID=A0A563VTG3_9CYAN|nr:pentapeptide repeat-containing protein [Hyella patelloides]VEP14766.1 conserved hypothetical protein [Hyella patelloides LEGE 07179]